MYDELVKRLRNRANGSYEEKCEGCEYNEDFPPCVHCTIKAFNDAADAIEELLKAAKAMHTWIFLNTGDEQAAYDECGLTDEMNAMLGYGGQFVAEPPKEET